MHLLYAATFKSKHISDASEGPYFLLIIHAGCIGFKVLGQKRPVDLKEISNLLPFQELMWLNNRRVLGEKC